MQSSLFLIVYYYKYLEDYIFDQLVLSIIFVVDFTFSIKDIFVPLSMSKFMNTISESTLPILLSSQSWHINFDFYAFSGQEFAHGEYHKEDQFHCALGYHHNIFL